MERFDVPAFAVALPVSTGLSNLACTSKLSARNRRSQLPRHSRASIPRTSMSVVEANQTPPSPEEEPQYTSKFDPESDVNAFGRDPRKETEFWRETAKTVLASDEVKEALASHENNNGDGLTDEQRAYMNFVKELDAEAAAKESKTE